VGSRDPTIRESNIEQFVHVPHDNHVAVKEDDPLRGFLLAAIQMIEGGHTSKPTRPNTLQSTTFVS